MVCKMCTEAAELWLEFDDSTPISPLLADLLSQLWEALRLVPVGVYLKSIGAEIFTAVLLQVISDQAEGEMEHFSAYKYHLRGKNMMQRMLYIKCEVSAAWESSQNSHHFVLSF